MKQYYAPLPVLGVPLTMYSSTAYVTSFHSKASAQDSLEINPAAMLALTSSVAQGLVLSGAPAHVHVQRVASPVMEEAKSQAIPFLKKPPGLDGSMVGDIGFDPLRLTDVVPISWAREAELKHARVCMLAFLGYVAVDLGFRVPGAPEVSSLYAHDAAVDNGSMLFMLLPIAVFEIAAGVPKVFQLLNDPDATAPGDYKFDPMNFSSKGTEEAKRTMAMKELANGRAAMMAFSGIVTQSALTGGGFPYTS